MPPLCWLTGRDLGGTWMPADVRALGGGEERRHIWGIFWSEDPSAAPCSGVWPRRSSAAWAELPSRGNVPQDARCESKIPLLQPSACNPCVLLFLCPHIHPVSFSNLCPIFTFPAGTSKALHGPTVCRPVVCSLSADGLRQGQGWETAGLSLGLVWLLSLRWASGNIFR